jgi:YVTN family beta-propeller protein
LRRPAPLLLLAATLALSDSVRAASWIFVSNEKSGTVTLIDGATNRVTGTIAVGARPRGIQPSPDGRHVYVAVSDKADRSREAIVEIEAASRRISARYRCGTDPEQLAVSPDGSRLYVSNEDASTASVIWMRRPATRLCASSR